MKKLLDSIRQSFSARLSIWVVLFATLIFVASMAYLSFIARRSVQKEAVLRASQVLENTVLRMNNILEDVQLSADYLEWLVYRHLDEPQMMMDYTRNTLQTTPALNGCSVSFEPYHFKGQEYFSAYSGYDNGLIHSTQEGGDNYQYFYMDWYQLPKLLNQPCWTEPYGDWETDDDRGLETWMEVSYSKPLNAPDGTFIGAISLDISLAWLSQTLSDIRPYPNAYSMLLSRGGTFLVHPDPEKLFYETIFTRTLLEDDPDLVALGEAMLKQEDGMRTLTIGGQRSYVFYTPLRSTGWSMAIVCPESDIFGGLVKYGRILLLITLVGLGLLFFVCRRVISNTVRPLRNLSDQAERIADGHFDTPFPDSGRTDEIGKLARSFGHMQRSLVSYMDELTRTTANRVRIEGELQIARDIQMGMIPRTFPPFPERKDLDLYASLEPAKEVSGDLYDYFIQDERLYFCVGDVSGKGIPASLVMAVARNLFRVAGKQGVPPAEIARQINEILSDGNDRLMFVTMLIGVADLRTGQLDYCNCGHNQPILLNTTGTPEPTLLECLPNTALGICPGFAFEDQRLESLHGRALLVYTDGLNEAEDADHEELGMDRVMAALQAQPYAGAEATVAVLHRAVKAHVGEAEPSDDLTLLCLEIRK